MSEPSNRWPVHGTAGTDEQAVDSSVATSVSRFRTTGPDNLSSLLNLHRVPDTGCSLEHESPANRHRPGIRRGGGRILSRECSDKGKMSSTRGRCSQTLVPCEPEQEEMELWNARPSVITQVEPQHATPWPAAEHSKVLFLMDARDELDRGLLRDWVDRTAPNRTGPRRLFARLAKANPTLGLKSWCSGDESLWLQPLRIVWVTWTAQDRHERRQGFLPRPYRAPGQIAAPLGCAPRS